jgi:hypothetical protein
MQIVIAKTEAPAPRAGKIRPVQLRDKSQTALSDS